MNQLDKEIHPFGIVQKLSEATSAMLLIYNVCHLLSNEEREKLLASINKVNAAMGLLK